MYLHCYVTKLSPQKDELIYTLNETACFHTNLSINDTNLLRNKDQNPASALKHVIQSHPQLLTSTPQWTPNESHTSSHPTSTPYWKYHMNSFWQIKNFDYLPKKQTKKPTYLFVFTLFIRSWKKENGESNDLLLKKHFYWNTNSIQV